MFPHNKVALAAAALVFSAFTITGCGSDDAGGGPGVIPEQDANAGGSGGGSIGPTYKCYTPCSQGITLGDKYLACPADGLMPGCFGGAECKNGTCVMPGSKPATLQPGPEPAPGNPGLQPQDNGDDGGIDPDGSVPEQDGAAPDAAGSEPPAGSCTTDLECPEFQICDDGVCHSNCDSDDQCAASRRCHKHVCRKTCTSSDPASCSNGNCKLLDGQNGVCMPKAGTSSEQGQGETPASGKFSVSENALDLTPTVLSGSFKLRNDGPTKQTFTIRKAQEVQFTDEGTKIIPVAANPLAWVKIGLKGQEDQVQQFTVEVPGKGGEVEIGIAEAKHSTMALWDGLLLVENKHLGQRRIGLHYVGSPQGQWQGSMMYFASFGDTGLQNWMADRGNIGKLQLVGNAFVKRWGALKQGDITLDEFLAVLSATKSESWKNASVKSRCPDQNSPNPNQGCYLYADQNQQNDPGIRLYSNALDAFPIPTGSLDLPITINLKKDPSGGAADWVGRVVSSESMHYAGDPRVILTFRNDPSTCTQSNKGNCLVLLDDVVSGSTKRPGFHIDVFVGGRYVADPSDASCSKANSFEHSRLPWLVPGFQNDLLTGKPFESDPNTGYLYRHECRDTLLPFTTGTGIKGANISFAGSNPVPDGRTRKRTIEFVDGTMINQNSMFVIFKESFPSFLGSTDADGFSAYGYMMLRRMPKAPTNDSDYEGSVPSDNRPSPDLLGVQCSPEMLSKAGGVLTPSTAPNVASVMLHGINLTATPEVIDASHAETVHYYCQDTGLIDSGPAGSSVPCPTGSNVIYFTTNTAQLADLSGQACQANGLQFSYELKTNAEASSSHALTFIKPGTEHLKGTCGQYVQAQKVLFDQNPLSTNFRFNVVWRCADPQVAYCDNNRYNMRADKIFYAAMSQNQAPFLPLSTAADMAFRYKTKFVNREGKNLGFTPEMCQEGADDITYCYDPIAIEQLRQRVDCLLSIYTKHYADLDPAKLNGNAIRQQVKDFLLLDFSQTIEPQTLIVHDGFERLLSELLIMQGDEMYTQAFTARYDLAGLQLGNFQGSLFEPNGIDLAGGAGFEMYRLYQATQYYQLALDRFYGMSPAIWKAINELPVQANVITAATVVTYFDRLIRASGQKARAWSEISKRYQSFNRPDLARRAVERAYTAAYLESIVLSRMMLKVVEVSDPKNKAQIIKAIEDGMLRSRMGLLDMRNVYKDINDDVTYFGFPKDYIPFPVLDSGEANAVIKMIQSAKDKLDVATIKEQAALQSKQSFETSQAVFVDELNKLKSNYEEQLGEVCGLFKGEDGNVYPAIPKYADLSQRTRVMQQVMGTPCGFVGNGEISDKMVELSLAKVDLEAVVVAQQRVLKEIEIEQTRVNKMCSSHLSRIEGKCPLFTQFATAQCAEFTDQATKECAKYTQQANFMFGTADCDRTKDENKIKHVAGIEVDPCKGMAVVTDSLNKSIKQSEQAIDDLRRVADIASDIAAIGAAGDVFTKVGSVAAAIAYGVTAGIAEVAVYTLQGTIVEKQDKVAEIQRDVGKWELTKQCDLTTLAQETQCDLAKLQADSNCDIETYDVGTECELAKIDSDATVKTKVLELRQIELDALRAQYNLQLTLSQIQKAQFTAQATADRQTSDTQNLFNVAAAQTDPNVRIYKNDAIMSAERTFNRAMRAAYEATRVYEYYTSQSYAKLDQLFLIRTVQYGDYSLENYVAELEDAFSAFGEQHGKPDNRVAILSLRDDVLQIPRQEQGTALSHEDRIERFRGRLQEPGLLDENGYITLPFSTSLNSVSPLTRNHKIRYVEAELVGSNQGDEVARLYLQQRGTSTIRSLLDEKSYYALPEKTAVINAFLSGQRIFADEVYINERLRDRPYVNTDWRVVINQRDESCNADLDLLSLEDIRLYLYYGDFTAY